MLEYIAQNRPISDLEKEINLPSKPIEKRLERLYLVVDNQIQEYILGSRRSPKHKGQSSWRHRDGGKRYNDNNSRNDGYSR